MLWTRIVTAAVLVPAVLAGMFLLPPRAWGFAALLVVVAGAHEWAMLAGFERRRWLIFVGGTFLIGVNLLLLGGDGFEQGWPDSVVLAVCGAATVFWLAIAPFWLARRWKLANPLLAAAVGWLVLIATWVAMVELQARSPWLVLAAMAIVWIADTAAYFTGRAVGRHKLAPEISPGKTWEGVAGALAAVAIYALVLALWAPGFAYSGPRTPAVAGGVIVLAMALAGISVLGDLLESLLKRQRGVKDSGRVLPGHGGVLDRIDALMAALPVATVAATLLLR